MMRFYCFLFIIINCLSANLIAQNLTLKILGASTQETKVIDSINYASSFKNLKTLTKEIDSMQSTLIRIGYIDSKLNGIEKQNDSTFNANLYLGPKINSIIVSIKNIDPNLLKSLDVILKDTIIEIKFKDLENKLSTINKTISEEGDPFSRLKLVDIKKENSNTLSAKLEIVTNQKRTIDKIIVKGYEKFPKSFVRHFLKLKPGKSFNISEIKEKTETLQQLRFANQIKEPEVLFTNDSTILYLYTEKAKSNNFDGFLGFGTNENTNKIEFDGYLNLTLINNLNYGESLRLLYKSDEIDQQTIDISTDLPFIFGSPLDIKLGLNIFRKDTTFSTTSQFVKINYQINTRSKIGIGLTGVTSSNLLSTSFTNLEDYNSNYYNINYQFIKPQYYDALFPINFWIECSLGFGDRTSTNNTLSQNIFQFDSYKIINLNQSNSIYIRLKAAGLFSDNYLQNELFRFGGINSIRGFEENSLVANLFSVINTEYRYRLGNSIYVHSVIDASYSENDIQDSKTKLFGFGFGFGLLTQAGLFRLNYSSGKTEGQQFKFSDSKVHISLTATF